MAAYTVYGYEGEAYLLTEIIPPTNLRTGEPVVLRTKITWMMCAQVCLPSTTKAELEMVVGEKELVRKKESAIFEKIREGFPRAGKSWAASASRVGDEVVLLLKPAEGAPALDPAKIYFFSTDGLIHSDAKQRKSMGDGGAIELRLKVSEFGPKDMAHLRGEVVYEGKSGWEKEDPTFTSMVVDVPFMEQ